MLRPATDVDRDLVLRWRNHPDVRAVSLTRHEIGAAEHAGWWTATALDPTRRLLVYVRHDIPSGVVSFFDIDPAELCASWGYYLDNTGLRERGELLPAWIEIQRQAIAYAFGDLGLRTLEGEVLLSNDSVRRLNTLMGFREVQTYERLIDGDPVTVARIRRAVDA